MPLSTEVSSSFERWRREAEKHWQSGDYHWMAEQVDADARVLEVGCGAGHSTLALSRRVRALMTIEPDVGCRAMTEARLVEAAAKPVKFIDAKLGALPITAEDEIAGFAPEWVVCWLMGVPDSALDPALAPAQAVQKEREAVHRAVAALAVRLPSVKVVQFIDRTAFPWKIKDTAREMLAVYHAGTTFAGLPFSPDITGAHYRKLDDRIWPTARMPGKPAVVPVLGVLQVTRNA